VFTTYSLQFKKHSVRGKRFRFYKHATTDFFTFFKFKWLIHIIYCNYSLTDSFSSNAFTHC